MPAFFINHMPLPARKPGKEENHMQTIIVLLNPGKLENPDMDLCYCVPDRIEEASGSLIQSSGYDFIDTEEGRPGPLMGIWLKAERADEGWPVIAQLFQRETFMGNNLSLSAEIYISENDTDTLENCSLVFPGEHLPRGISPKS